VFTSRQAGLDSDDIRRRLAPQGIEVLKAYP
jgi:hypothetical protein